MFSSIAHETKFWSFTRKRFCVVCALNCARILVVRALDCARFLLHPAPFSQPSWNTEFRDRCVVTTGDCTLNPASDRRCQSRVTDVSSSSISECLPVQPISVQSVLVGAIILYILYASYNERCEATSLRPAFNTARFVQSHSCGHGGN